MTILIYLSICLHPRLAGTRGNLDFYNLLFRLGILNLFYKMPHRKYFHLCGSYGLVTTTQLCFCSTHATIDRWTWMCAKKTWFANTGSGPDLAHGPQFTDPWFREKAATVGHLVQYILKVFKNMHTIWPSNPLLGLYSIETIMLMSIEIHLKISLIFNYKLTITIVYSYKLYGFK